MKKAVLNTFQQLRIYQHETESEASRTFAMIALLLITCVIIYIKKAFVCQCHCHDLVFDQSNSSVIEMKFSVQISWDTMVVCNCSYIMDNSSFSSLIITII